MSGELSRRTFLKIMGVTSVAAAGCGKPAARELIPYVIPDENVVPGVPSFYTAMCNECPAACGVVARVREGRVIKLEGNPKDPISQGALCARGQAALQGLYNPDRLSEPMQRRADGTLTGSDWDHALQAVGERLRAASVKGRDRVALLGPVPGPAMQRIVQQWLGSARSTRWIAYEALDDAPARAAAAACFGRSDLPVYRLDAAETVLAFGADYLETWRSPVELTRQYAALRVPRPGAGGIQMGHAIYVGPRFNLTAANSDRWVSIKPGQEALIALAVLHTVVRHGRHAGEPSAGALRQLTTEHAPDTIAQRTGVARDVIEHMARLFAEANGAVALAGTDDLATHVAASLLNAITGNIGKTMQFLGPPPPAPQHGPHDLRALLQAIQADAVDVLVIAGSNPAFTASPSLQVLELIKRVPYVVWCGGVPDETAALAHLLLPVHHTLESWGDAAPRSGVDVLSQPVMQPVHETLPLGDVLLATARLAAPDAVLPWPDTRAAVEATWRERHGQNAAGEPFALFWEGARRTGGLFRPVPAAAVQLRPEVLQQPLPREANPEGLLLAAYPHIFMYDGRGADKPWLQEIPEPVAQIVWDGWAELHHDTARQLGADDGDVLELQSAHGRIRLPALLSTGVAPGVIAVPIGQGHSAYGRSAQGRGANVWQLLPPGRRTVPIQARRTGARHTLVSPLGSDDMRARNIVGAMSLAQLRKGVTPAPHAESAAPFEIRPIIEYPRHQWGMTIDLSACTGCSACVAACYAENNLPVVGQREISRGHIHSWIRIDRYVPRTAEAPALYIIPMLCQQCDHAPCEPVCPVYASYHTEEGMNGQVYNRCIGTRYCENNCPYKVRRFNWFKPEWPSPLHLQLNPDVTTRGAGVMEKCTFCIQRIRAAEMDAADQQRDVHDGEIIPACAQACPAQAITFGDRKDPHSAMMRRRADHQLRAYRALEELNTDPAIVYLREVYRSPEEG